MFLSTKHYMSVITHDCISLNAVAALPIETLTIKITNAPLPNLGDVCNSARKIYLHHTKMNAVHSGKHNDNREYQLN
jgi:hypothetical protein